MADQRKEFDPLQPNLDGGEMNSEHERDTGGLQGTGTDKSTWTEEDRRRSRQGSMENIRKQRERETGDPEQSTVRHLRSASMTEMDEREKARGNDLAPRTPEEMSLMDEISREPIKAKGEKKEQD